MLLLSIGCKAYLVPAEINVSPIPLTLTIGTVRFFLYHTGIGGRRFYVWGKVEITIIAIALLF